MKISDAFSFLKKKGGGTNNTEDTLKEEKENQSCFHLTIYFEDKPVTFKECEGYDISSSRNGGSLGYAVSKDDKEIIRSGSYTSIFNAYYVNHNNIDEIIDHPSVQKSR